MKRFLMMAAVVAGVSVTGLTGSAMAGYPGNSGYGRGYVTPSYSVHHGGFGGANRGCWGGYRTLPVRPICKPYPYKYGNNCGNNYGSNYGNGYGYGSSYGGYFGGFGGSNWNW